MMNKHLTECRAISSKPQRGRPIGKKAARAQPVRAAQPSRTLRGLKSLLKSLLSNAKVADSSHWESY